MCTSNIQFKIVFLSLLVSSSMLNAYNQEHLDEVRSHLAIDGAADFSGYDLSGANLDSLNLSNCNFSGANLIGASLKNAILKNCNFMEVNLSGVMLNDAQLDDALLIGSQLPGASLQRASLKRAMLINANCQNVNFTRADMTGIYAAALTTGGSVVKPAKKHIHGLPWVKKATQKFLQGATAVKGAADIGLTVAASQVSSIAAVVFNPVGLGVGGGITGALFILIGTDKLMEYKNIQTASTDFRGAIFTGANMRGGFFAKAKFGDNDGRATLQESILVDADITQAQIAQTVQNVGSLPNSSLKNPIAREDRYHLMHLAIKHNWKEIVEKMVNQHNPAEVIDDVGENVPLLAHVHVVPVLREETHLLTLQGDDTGDNPLHLAVKYNKNTIIRTLSVAHDFVHACQQRNTDGLTPLGYAIHSDNKTAYDSILNNFRDLHRAKEGPNLTMDRTEGRLGFGQGGRANHLYPAIDSTLYGVILQSNLSYSDKKKYIKDLISNKKYFQPITGDQHNNGESILHVIVRCAVPNDRIAHNPEGRAFDTGLLDYIKKQRSEEFYELRRARDSLGSLPLYHNARRARRDSIDARLGHLEEQDIGGLSLEINELREYIKGVSSTSNPHNFFYHGPTGTGKTLIAKGFAKSLIENRDDVSLIEAEKIVSLLNRDRSEAEKLRLPLSTPADIKAFYTAVRKIRDRNKKHCLLLIDDGDHTISFKKNYVLENGQRVPTPEATTNRIVAEQFGDGNRGVTTLVTTNYFEDFSNQIISKIKQSVINNHLCFIDSPNEKQRYRILQALFDRKILKTNIGVTEHGFAPTLLSHYLGDVAKRTNGFSGRNLEDVLTLAAERSNDLTGVTRANIERAIRNVGVGLNLAYHPAQGVMGPENRNMVLERPDHVGEPVVNIPLEQE